MALEHFRHELEIETKPDRSFVTQADKAIERYLREGIADAHPDHGLIGEEEGAEGGGASVRWYIDPIDGTHNFMRGVPLFGTLLGIERDGEMQVGVISAPALRERWFAWRGGGAWASGSAGLAPGELRRIRTSRLDRLEESQLLYSSPTDIEPYARRLPAARRAGLARPRLRRLLGLRARRRGRRRGDDRGRHERLGPGRAADDHRGGRRPRDRLRGRPLHPRTDDAGHATASCTTRSWPRCQADGPAATGWPSAPDDPDPTAPDRTFPH